MPNCQKSHDECLQSVCLLCLRKAERRLRDSIGIEHYILPNYTSVQHLLPVGVCEGCRRIISSLSGPSPRPLPPRLNYELMLAELSNIPVSRRSQPNCPCKICKIARSNLHKNADPCSVYATDALNCTRGRPSTGGDAAETPLARLCSGCHSPIGKGKPHRCNRATRLANLSSLLSPGTAEQVASTTVAAKLQTTGSSTVTLKRAQGGRPLALTVGNPNAASSSGHLPPTSTATMLQLKVALNLSNRQTLRAASILRKGASSRKAVQPNLAASLTVRSQHLTDFFTTKLLEIDSERAPAKTAVICSNVRDLIDKVAFERGYAEVEVKLGLDGGGEFFKICASLLPRGESEAGQSTKGHQMFVNSGVKKLLLLAAVPDMTECYANIKALFQQLSLGGTTVNSVAADMKVANIICGLQSHASRHPCCYCEAPVPLDTCGPMRTVGRIRQLALDFSSSGKVRSSAKDYCNCVEAPLLQADDNAEILFILPPPELHLMLGITNRIFDALNSAWGNDSAYQWAHDRSIMRVGYRGGSMEGNACRTLLRKSAELHSCLPHQLKRYGSCLVSFDAVVSSCFGSELHADFQHRITEFKTAFELLGLPISPKVHVLLHHVGTFCSATGSSLGKFSEQAFESVHRDFSQTWQRYAVPRQHSRFPDALLQAVVAYNSFHV